MKKTLTLSLLFCIPLILLGATFFQGGDYIFHFQKASVGCDSSALTIEQQEACKVYTPLFHWLAIPFSFSENAFFYFTIFLFIIVSPLVIFYYSKSWYSTLLYFGASNYVFYFMDGIFPQAVANLFLFILFFTKDRRIEIAIIPLLILTHGSALIAGIALLFFKHVDLKGWLCSSVFLNNKPEAVYEKIGSTGGIDFSVNNILHFFTLTFPFPFMIIALKETWDKNQRYFGVLVFLIFMGFIYANIVWYLSFLIAIPAMSSYYQSRGFLGRACLIVFTLAFGIIQFYLFWNYHTYCVV